MKNLISFSKKIIKQEGIKTGTQRLFRHLLGMTPYEDTIKGLSERIDTLAYLMNETIDITSIPATKNQDLRILQQCDSLLLRLFDKFCKKHNLEYWLVFGTLLGAVRHKGFIPWDDDMDVAMPREHFNKLIKLLSSEFNSQQFTISDFGKPGCMIGFGYEHEKTGIWLDVFPVDIYSSSQKLDEIRGGLTRRINEYRSFYNKEYATHDVDFFEIQRKKYFFCDGEYEICYHNLENGLTFMCEKNDVFPLTSLEYEGYSFPVPHNYDKYLRIFYGDYMLFPTGGVLHHDYGRGALHTWAKKNCVDMNEIKNVMKNNLDRF